jgi:hypothetical protein
MNLAECKTIKARLAFFKDKLLTDDRWILRALLAVYSRQTAEEQDSQVTKEDNNMGFSGIDAEIMTSFAKRLLAKNGSIIIHNPRSEVKLSFFFSEGQEAILRRRIVKYARQLERHSRPARLDKKQSLEHTVDLTPDEINEKLGIFKEKTNES